MSDRDVIRLLREAHDRTDVGGEFNLNAALRGGQQRARRRHIAQAAAATVVIAAVVATAVVLTPRTVTLGQSQMSPAAPGVTQASEQLALLAQPQQEQDELPAGLISFGTYDVTPYNLVLTSTRLVAQTPDARFWAATNSDNEVCLLIYLVGERRGEFVSTTRCVPVPDFAEDGVAAAARHPLDRLVRAHLLPDDHTGATPAPEGMSYLAPNLATNA